MGIKKGPERALFSKGYRIYVGYNNENVN